MATQTPDSAPKATTMENADSTSTQPVKTQKRATVFQVLRLTFTVVLFITGCLSICLSQVIIKTACFFSPELQQDLMEFTKKNFVILLTFVTSLSAPTKLTLSVDSKSMSSNSIISKNGKLSLNLDPNAIIIANHQIYSDWLFLWFLAYLNNCSQNIFIIMKKSLSKIPILGFGMKNYDFIFLSRKWEVDKYYMIKQFRKLTGFKKHWLLIFPEGTNLSSNTKPRSDSYINKLGLSIKLDHIMLPRTKGLYLACKYLKPHTKRIYDFTMGYSGHSPEEYAQDIFTLGQIYLFGNGPKEVKIHIRCIEIDDIKGCSFDETHDDDAFEEADMTIFEKWLSGLWKEKDALMEKYYTEGGFVDSLEDEVSTELRLGSRLEILNVYVIPLVSFVVIRGIIGYAFP